MSYSEGGGWQRQIECKSASVVGSSRDKYESVKLHQITIPSKFIKFITSMVGRICHYHCCGNRRCNDIFSQPLT